ncbi:MAG: Uma2 family endonuclease [Oscillatoriales cyanobacterium C42_A2020_001]|nr:Uma2 family endonuclease [Leptolyngbyaceae cyanobacterium C42_A2020_001]
MVTTPNPVIEELKEEDYDYNASSLPPECYDVVPEGWEEVDGVLVEKTGMTIAHAATQGKVIYWWTNHILINQLGGEVYPEAPCQTNQQKRRPDVAYMSPELLAQYGRPAILPQSYSLIGEVASPDDEAEMLFSKAREYLRSGCQEVWLLYPENQLVIIATEDSWQIFTGSDAIATQKVLPGFTISVAELFA